MPQKIVTRNSTSYPGPASVVTSQIQVLGHFPDQKISENHAVQTSWKCIVSFSFISSFL